MKVLIVGQSGQLASALLATAPAKYEVLNPGRSELDLAEPDKCYAYVLEHKPDWVINAGAYTRVDDAEDNEAEVMQINFESPVQIATALQMTGGNLLQISSDYVFGGERLYAYSPKNPLKPLNVYGLSKARAEDYLKMLLPPTKLMVLRTSWLYSGVGQNFVKSMVKAFQEKNGALVVADQYGCPTAVKDLARACWQTVQYGLYGVWHWTDGAVMSWADFADAIAEEAFELRLLQHRAVVQRICTEDYPAKAKRPLYSVLDCSDSYEYLGLGRPDWRANLRTVLKELKKCFTDS